MINTKHIDKRILYPLTHPQKRIWYMEKIYPDKSLHNIGGPVRIKGPVIFSLLEEAINVFINKNEGLRLRFIEQNEEVYQYICEYKKIELCFKDFSKFEDPEKEFNNWVNKEAKKPFVIKNDELFYFALFKITENDNGYLVKFHHIIADGWSMNILTEQICDIYMKLMHGEKVSSEIENSYIEYIEQECKYLNSDRFLKNKLFWNEKYKILPDTFINTFSDVLEGRRKSFELDLDISLNIKEFALSNKFSINTFFVTLYILYLNKTVQQNNIVIGTPVLNRSGKKEKSIFGMFTSTMPFRYVLDEDCTITEIMTKVGSELMYCYFNQRYPYDLLVKDLELKKKGYDQLFNICINYYNTKLNSELDGSAVENTEFYNGSQIYSMQLVIKEWSKSGNLTLDFDYKISDYTDEQIDYMYSCLNNLIIQVINNPEKKVEELSLLSENEMDKLLYKFNATETEYPKDKSIHQIFEEQVKKTPDKIAICFDENELTYNELNEKANNLTRFLIKKGIEEESIVGLLTNHSIETIIGILGILKAGGAYLPIDPTYPIERINYMLKDSNSKILLTNCELNYNYDFKGEVINLNNVDLYKGEGSNIESINKSCDLAYVIYTSGSTGKPKGVMIEHKGLVNYILWAKQMYIKSENEVFALYSSIAFDLTITTIFSPLIIGGKIIIYSDDQDEYVLNRIMKENKATIIKLTPSHLVLLKDLDNRNSSVKRFIVGGEDLKVSLAKAIQKSFGGKIEIFNEYGPTETVVGCMIHKFNSENDTLDSVPIGVPAQNVQIYILDKNLNPLPVGAIGEIYVSGDGVARGYLNSVELTTDRFISNPFKKGARMYKTGDLARFLDDGKIQYIGRTDNQVKIHGYRIELGEIETRLEKHKALKQTIVIECEDNNKDKYLCAYIVRKTDVSENELKDYLSSYLPDYMIPRYFIALDKIPLTANGKVNRDLLPEPKYEVCVHDAFATYRNEKEKKLVEVVCDLFSLENISVKQNFYHLGGDSIKAIQISSRMNNNGFKLNVKDILSHPLIEEMALHIKQNDNLNINQICCEGTIKSTPIVSWFFSQKFSRPNYYNQSIILEIYHDLEVVKLEVILNELIRYHDSLRINYNSAKEELFYNNEHLNKYYSIEEYYIGDLLHHEQCAEQLQKAEDLRSGFDIEKDILIKACLFNLGQNGKRLFITAHHLVVDGVSWRIILDDINTLLKQVYHKEKIELPAKTNTFQEWADKLGIYSGNEVYAEKAYWENTISSNFVFPLDYDLGADLIKSSKTIFEQIDEDETIKLTTKANLPFNTEPKDLIITSLLKTIKSFTESENIAIELESHGRDSIINEIELSRTVGWFTSLYPISIKIKDSDLACQIKEVKEQLRKVPHNGISYGILKYLYSCIEDNNERYIRFNYLGEFTTKFDNGLIKLLNEQIGNDISESNHLTCLIEINCFVISGKLNMLLTYSRNKFAEKTMNKFISLFKSNLISIVNYCCNTEGVQVTPSDFDTIEFCQEELDSLFINE